MLAARTTVAGAILLGGVVGSLAPARANDSAAVLEAGGIVLARTDAVAMESEDLVIGREKVSVSYVFRNVSGKDQDLRVAFPVPEHAGEDELGDVQLDVGSKNPMKFSVVVDGKPQAFTTEIKRGDGKVKITHHWMQRFPRDRTVAIRHEYVPVTGGFFVLPPGEVPEADDRDLDRELARRYCVGPKLLAKLRKKGAYVRNVHYTLKSGGNWAGPIGRFRLTIQKGSAGEQVSVCLPDTRRSSPTTFTVERTSFTPTSDLAILFIP